MSAEAVAKLSKLSKPQREMLQRIAGHKYGWCYISRRERPTADALERRGLVEYGISHDRDHWDCPQVSATAKGKGAIQFLWPTCPFVRGTHDPLPSGGTGRG